MKQPTFSNSIGIFRGIALLLLAVMAMLLFQIEDRYQIALLLMAGALGGVGLPSRLDAIDCGLCLIALYEGVSCLWAACPLPASRTAFYTLYCLTSYFLVRRLLASGVKIPWGASYLPIGIALLLSIGSFFVFRNSVLGVGFPDTYSFRFLFRPLGYITNVWSEVLLVLLGWISLMRRHAMLFLVGVLLAILLSFSRGAYIALGVYLLGGILWWKPRSEKWKLGITAVAACLLTYLLCPTEMRTTLQMNRTTSQQQSTESRIDATQAAWDAFCEHPLVGYGSNNFTYAIDTTLNQDSTRPYTSFAPNLIVQLLVEKGVVGTLLYVGLAVGIIVYIWKRRDNVQSRIIGITLLALGVKDLTQATWLSTPFTLWMSFVLLAFLPRGEEGKGTVSLPWMRYLLPVWVSLYVLTWNVPAWKQRLDPTAHLLRQALEAMEQDERRPEAARLLAEAATRHPEDIQIRYLQGKLSLLNGNLSQAETIWQPLATTYPRNSLYTWSYAHLLYVQQDTAKALDYAVEAIRYTPRLLTHERITQWAESDTAFYQTLRERLYTLTPSPEDSPSDYARAGYIARWCDHPQADTYLRAALQRLPNLATPWHLLGDDRKYRLLLYGAFHQNLSGTTLPEEEPLTDARLLEMAYVPKCQNWYGMEWKEGAE